MEAVFHAEHKKAPCAGLCSTQGQYYPRCPGPARIGRMKALASLSGFSFSTKFWPTGADLLSLHSNWGQCRLLSWKLSTYCPIPCFPKRQTEAGCSSGPVNQFSGKETLNTPNAAYWSWVNSAHHSLLCCQKSLSLPQSRTPEDEGSHHSCCASPPSKETQSPSLGSTQSLLHLCPLQHTFNTCSFCLCLFLPLLSVPFNPDL